MTPLPPREMLDVETIRERLSFDVQRLIGAGDRLEAVSAGRADLERRLRVRVQALTEEAVEPVNAEQGGDGSVSIRYAQAQATAELARGAKLGEILASSGRLSLICSMAVTRWVSAVAKNRETPLHETVLKAHIDGGRLAHRMLATLRPREKLRSGCGQITAAVVVAEYAHAENRAFVEEEILEGLARGRTARGVASDDDVLAAVSRALRAAAGLLESMASRAEPALASLLSRADTVESDVAEELKTATGVSGQPTQR